MRKILTLIAAVLSLSMAASAQKDTLRILAIGNSFSSDATQSYLYDIAKASGCEFVIGNMFIGGCPLEKHWNNAGSDEKRYTFSLNKGGKTKNSKASLLDGVRAEKWDIITLQQASGYSGREETYEPYLGNLMAWLKENVTGTPTYFWHQTWAYAKNSTHKKFSSYGSDQMKMYTSIMDAAGKACSRYGLKVIPSGTAIQNGRTTSLGENFTRDGFHMSMSNGRFTVACTWFETFTGIDVRTNGFIPNTMQAGKAEICKAAAHAAVQNPWNVTRSRNYTGEKLVKERTNYDESKIPAYTLPDALTMNDGRKVKKKSDWYGKRRGELLSMFTEEMFGKVPVECPEGITYEVVESDTKAFDGLATRKQVKITVPDRRKTSRKKDLSLMLLLYTPNGHPAKGAPVFLGMNFKGNETATNDPAVIPAAENGNDYGIYRQMPRGAQADRWVVETILKRGYGLATLYYFDVAPDYDSYSKGIYPLLDKKRNQGDEWGHIAAWAWGLRRAMDYLETDKDVNAKKVAVNGHSRLGKTALWAGATDRRFAMVISNDSGCCGAALSRRRIGENIETITLHFPYWFCRNFWKYADKEETLPFDQHELLALIAPRPLYVASSDEDLWADPKGEELSLKEAEKVYKFLRAKGKTAYHCKQGKHSITAEDWAHYLDFADKHLK